MASRSLVKSMLAVSPARTARLSCFVLFGMYSSAGEFTCARYEGSLDHETYDAESWALWDVDYLKYDNCYHRGRFGNPEITFNRYNVMAQALNATGRNILYSLCSWGEDYVHTWGASIANSWRISGDIYDSFTRPDDLCSCTDSADPHCVAPGNHCSVLNIINKVAPFIDRGQPGGWNDMDMLEVGLGGMNNEEYKSPLQHVGGHQIPLLIGADLRELSPATLTILNNPAVIAINQDPLGRPAGRIYRNKNVNKDEYGEGETQIWSGPLHGGDQVVVFLNAADEDIEMKATLNEIFDHEGPHGSAPQTRLKWTLHDLWENRMDGKTAQKILDSPVEKLESVFKQADWYNSTTVTYKDGLITGDERLLGKAVVDVHAGGEIKVKVKRHGVKMYRMRTEEKGAKRYVIGKEEL